MKIQATFTGKINSYGLQHDKVYFLDLKIDGIYGTVRVNPFNSLELNIPYSNLGCFMDNWANISKLPE